MAETSFSLLQLARAEPDSEAWRHLVAIYSPLLQVWLWRYDMPSADANDLTPDVLLSVARELPRFEHSGRAGAFR